MNTETFECIFPKPGDGQGTEVDKLPDYIQEGWKVGPPIGDSDVCLFYCPYIPDIELPQPKGTETTDEP